MAKPHWSPKATAKMIIADCASLRHLYMNRKRFPYQCDIWPHTDTQLRRICLTASTQAEAVEMMIEEASFAVSSLPPMPSHQTVPEDLAIFARSITRESFTILLAGIWKRGAAGPWASWCDGNKLMLAMGGQQRSSVLSIFGQGRAQWNYWSVQAERPWDIYIEHTKGRDWLPNSPVQISQRRGIDNRQPSPRSEEPKEQA